MCTWNFQLGYSCYDYSRTKTAKNKNIGQNYFFETIARQYSNFTENFFSKEQKFFMTGSIPSIDQTTLRATQALHHRFIRSKRTDLQSVIYPIFWAAICQNWCNGTCLLRLYVFWDTFTSKPRPLSQIFDGDLYVADRKCISDEILTHNFDRLLAFEYTPSDKSKNVVNSVKVPLMTVYMV